MITLKKGTSIVISCMYHAPRSIETELDVSFDDGDIHLYHRPEYGYTYYYNDTLPVYKGDKVYRIDWICNI